MNMNMYDLYVQYHHGLPAVFIDTCHCNHDHTVSMILVTLYYCPFE